MKTVDFYTLRQVSDLTGLSEFTLRGWEGRYDAFSPRRTKTGRRCYSESDLKRAFLLRELTHLGHRIGDIAKMSNELLEKNLECKMADKSEKPGKFSSVDAIFKLVFLQDWKKLKLKLQRLFEQHPPLTAIDQVALPLLKELGSLVADKRLGIAQEHILSSLLKEQIYSLISKSKPNSKSGKNLSFVIATPDGDYHELGILIAHSILSVHGINSLFLGPNTPKKELCETAIRFGCSHILLASTVNRKSGAHEDIFSYLHYLNQHLPKDINLWLGGRNIETANLNTNRSWLMLNSLQQLNLEIKSLIQK